MITILTPTYNRAQTLIRLYESLKRQTCKDFVWLIINDGSSDGTDTIIDSFIKEGQIKIRYYKQQNIGLSRTLNKGVALTESDILFRIDSDDYATDDAIEKIYKYWPLVANDKDSAGVVFLRSSNQKSIIGNHPFHGIKVSNFFEYRDKYKGKGDRVEVVKTSVLKEYPFPYFDGEIFVPEGLMWNRIAQRYKATYIPESIYICEYRLDGLTRSTVFNLRKNARGTTLYYREIVNLWGTGKISFSYFFRNSILYWRYASFNKQGFFKNASSIPFLANILGIIPGLLIMTMDNMGIKVNSIS